MSWSPDQALYPKPRPGQCTLCQPLTWIEWRQHPVSLGQGGAAGRTRAGWRRCARAARRPTAWPPRRCCCRRTWPPTWTRWTSCWAGSASAPARAPWPARHAPCVAACVTHAPLKNIEHAMRTLVTMTSLVLVKLLSWFGRRCGAGALQPTACTHMPICIPRDVQEWAQSSSGARCSGLEVISLSYSRTVCTDLSAQSTLPLLYSTLL